ncbi:hypothetical protein E2C01_033540 [Portunus trituberculatus]|uniref:Uncharacterized protein n=1 Tax=Portunus trituberculatus TaxID=210409 RepID=A0A5B7F3P9_PORTR|nr:hypothetical protein [Portunus trituberculatus]
MTREMRRKLAKTDLKGIAVWGASLHYFSSISPCPSEGHTTAKTPSLKGILQGCQCPSVPILCLLNQPSWA